MKFTLALLPFILGMAVAAPAPEARADVEARQITTVGLTFYGGDNDARYTILAPADGSEFTISMRLHFISPGLRFQLPKPKPNPPSLTFSPAPFPYPPSLNHPHLPLCDLLQALSSPKGQTHSPSCLPSYSTLPSHLPSSCFSFPGLHFPTSNRNY